MRDPDAYVIVVDAAARYPSIACSKAISRLISAFLPDPKIYAQQLRSSLQQTSPPGTSLQSIVSRFIRTRSELSTLGIDLDETELIGALMNSLPANEFVHDKKSSDVPSRHL